jgi:hypothetical protein
MFIIQIHSWLSRRFKLFVLDRNEHRADSLADNTRYDLEEG